VNLTNPTNATIATAQGTGKSLTMMAPQSALASVGYRGQFRIHQSSLYRDSLSAQRPNGYDQLLDPPVEQQPLTSTFSALL
jgi:hypothetical protein